MATIASHFRISLDALVFEQEDTVFFNYKPFSERGIRNFNDYLQSLHGDLLDIRKLEDARFYYASSEVPITYYFLFPELTNFKLYIWGRTVWEFEYLKNYPFHFTLLSYPEVKLSHEILEMYMKVPSVELCNVNILDNTLNQIEYFLKSGAFKYDADALTLCDKLNELVDHLEKMAAVGKKTSTLTAIDASTADYDLYHNEMVYTNNTVLMDSSYGKAVYTAFDNPNFLRSQDPKLGRHMTEWFERLRLKSVPMSGDNEKRRSWFFNTLRKKVDRMRRTLELIVEE